MCVFHSSQFTFMTRNQAAQPPNIIVDTKSGGNRALSVHEAVTPFYFGDIISALNFC